ncbi:MAG TPA: hypothetical protein DDW67_06600 [Elusimicrobia bacterium]|nr:hypothetical protein [Elusimicrobiota bacterium]
MKKILTVEDDIETSRYYRALFTAAGYDVISVGDIESARRAFHCSGPDLVILDVGFPSGDVEEVYMMTRKILYGGKPVIFVTGLPDKVERIRLACPNVRLFAKPVPAEALLACVADFLGSPSA